MKRIALNVQAISPLAIRSDHAPGGAETTKYISGTALAGSLAAVYRGCGKDFCKMKKSRIFHMKEISVHTLSVIQASYTVASGS